MQGRQTHPSRRPSSSPTAQRAQRPSRIPRPVSSLYPRKASADETVSAADVRAQSRPDAADAQLWIERGLADLEERLEKEFADCAAQIRADLHARTTPDAESVHDTTAGEGAAPERQLSAWEEELALRRIARSYETYLITAAAVWVATGGELPPGEDIFLASMERLSALRAARLSPTSSSPSVSPPESTPPIPLLALSIGLSASLAALKTESQLASHEYTFFLSGQFGSREDWEESVGGPYRADDPSRTEEVNEAFECMKGRLVPCYSGGLAKAFAKSRPTWPPVRIEVLW
ncbi:hypothetical protein NBRC10513_004791 [Rhodotorula toruloides]